MKSKLFGIFGPIVLAAVLLLLLFFSPFKVNTHNPELIKAASSSMSGNVLRGENIKQAALNTDDDNYVPFFGSSELSRISPFHPSVLAEKYQRSYTPFLLGAAGTQSLTQYMMMQALGKDLKGRKIVFIISPQWFVKGGIKQDYFNAYYSAEQTLTWITGIKEIQASDKYLASRLLPHNIVHKDELLRRMLEGIADGKLPNKSDSYLSHLRLNMLRREDGLFSTIGMVSKQAEIEKNTKELPDTYNLTALNALADKMGADETRGNQFEIQRPFYKKRIKPNLKKLAGSQKDWDYRYSKEFSDFQLVLDQLAKEGTDCLFIIPPVNGRWSEYTGLSREMLDQFSNKIKYQLTSQGFNNIADFTNQHETRYFMADTIHLGWKGWLMADRKIAPYLKDTKAKKLEYHINNDYFLDPAWQKQDPTAMP